MKQSAVCRSVSEYYSSCCDLIKTFIFYSQHVVFFIGRIIDLMVPDVPEDVEMKIKRKHYLAKEALAENQVQQI